MKYYRKRLLNNARKKKELTYERMNGNKNATNETFLNFLVLT